MLLIMKNVDEYFAGKIYRHVDGGIYTTIFTGTSTVDLTEQVVYEHLWPFERKKWIRPSSEFFDGRFTEISHSEMIVLTRQFDEEYRIEASKQVTTNRQARKASK